MIFHTKYYMRENHKEVSSRLGDRNCLFDAIDMRVGQGVDIVNLSLGNADNTYRI